MSKAEIWSEIDKEIHESLQHPSCLTNAVPNIITLLEKLTSLMRNETYKSCIPESILNNLLVIMTTSTSSGVVIECLRTLRNCSGSNWVQYPVLWEKLLLATLNLIKLKVDQMASEEELLQLRIALQVVGNLLNAHPELTNVVWEKFEPVIEPLLTHGDEKLDLYAAFVVYGILRNSEFIRKLWVEDKCHLVTKLIESSHRGTLYSQFSIQLYLAEGLLKNFYRKLSIEARLYLLHQFFEFCMECQVSNASWNFVSQMFQERSGLILRTCETPAIDTEALEVKGLLEILAKASSSDRPREELQKDPNLLATAIDLLRGIHSLGQSGSNYFTSVQDHFSSVDYHPAVGFKGNLVRLLGNLCYRHAGNQDRMRQLEAIGPLLECCNLDARNPFIQQWSILAIRNLLEKNRANQELVASLTQQGVVQPSLLQDLPLVVEESEEGLRIRTVESDK